MKKIKIYIVLLFISMLWVGCGDDEQPPKYPPYNPTPYELTLPFKFPIMTIPAGSELTEEGIALGRKLFYDPILSVDSTLACAGCHKPANAFTDNNLRSEGVGGTLGLRQSMPVMNLGWGSRFFWDGRANSIEHQVLFPVEDPLEMKSDWVDVVDRLNLHKDYPGEFYAAFGTDEITQELVGKAIAQFERTMISGNSKHDRVVENLEFFTPSEERGFALFNSEEGDCFHCHGGALVTDNLFHNNGLDSVYEDIGLAKVTGKDIDIGYFKTPSLRNVMLTAPYMHDGRFATIEEVIDHYSEGLVNSSTIDPLMLFANEGGVHLTDQEKHDLIAYLKTLTDTTFASNPAFQNPFE